MRRGLVALAAALVAALALSAALGEVALTPAQYVAALTQPGSPPAEILWAIRLPRGLAAALVGGALGLSGGLMQGLLRNPLADPGVLGVSAFGGLGASLVIALGAAALPGAVEGGALAGALLGGAALTGLAARFREPEVLILFGVALSAGAGAGTALVFNLAPSPVAASEVLAWLLGSVENRSFADIALAVLPLAAGVALAAYAARGLRQLTLGEETAALSGWTWDGGGRRPWRRRRS